ncbi:hypothetical protein [Microbispora sp. NPDC049125]|uniref:hypothetical protein n=1 Tax=Microbispora sp. NPDC049125 TaxID=3154929 RepID=UPI00346550A9
MKALLAFLCVVAVGALATVFLLLRNVADSGPAEEHLASASTVAASPSPVARKSVLLDAGGAVIEEFSGDCASSGFPYLCRYVKEQLLAQDPLLPTRGGLTIKTTIDMRIQRAAQRAVDAYVDRYDPQIATQVMIVPGEGAIRAMATSYGDASGAGFQQGSTTMPYTLAAALATGLRYDDGFTVSDEYRMRSYATFKDCAGRPVGDPHIAIHNWDKDGNRFVTLRSGTLGMVNTFYMRLEQSVGLCETVEMAERLGLRRADGAPLQEYPTFTLGFNEADPLSVANSYATLAAHGRFCEPTVIAEIRDGSAAPRPFPPRCREVLEPAVADAVTGVLSDVLRKSALKGVGREAAGMPGRGDQFRTAWYAGYTPGLASAVSLGDSRGPIQHPLTDVTIGGRFYARVDGTSVPGLIWKKAMAEAVRGTPESRFVQPDTGRFGGCRHFCPN